MDLLKMGAELFMKNSNMASGLDIGTVTSALKNLLPTNGGNLDLQGIISKMGGGGLASLASSWLGDGGNESISPQQVVSMLGQDKVSSFAQSLGMGESEASSGLASMLPDLIDKSSSGGSLMKSVGGGLLGKLFK